MKLCDYGCGQEGRYIVTKDGKMCCEPHRNSCPNMINKNKEGQKRTGFKWSKEQRKEMSKNRKGEKNGMYGKTHTFENRMKFKRRLKGKKYEELFGKKKAKKLKENYSNKMKGRDSWNKGLKREEYCDIETLKKWRYSIKQIKEKYPTLFLIEEVKIINKNGLDEIYAHCKNHNCPNSKEQGGWFLPDRYFLFTRARSLERGDDLNYLYCSEKCKQECPLYGLNSNYIIKQNELINEELYTSSEYQIFREEVFERSKNKCEYCGKKATDVHHSRPQKLEPGFVLDPDFGVACCKECHYKYGHKKGTECSTSNLANKICNK